MRYLYLIAWISSLAALLLTIVTDHPYWVIAVWAFSALAWTLVMVTKGRA